MEDYLKGSVSGIAQIISGHPFDTIKVLKQNNITFKFTNISSLYKGIAFPMISNSVIIGSQFYLYHNHSSLLAGIISGLIVAPVDYMKIQKQTIKNYKYKLVRPLGINITILRESIAIPIYFNTYYYLNDKTNMPFLSGGITGVLSWLVPYPVDTIKSRMQNGMSFEKSLKLGTYWKGLRFCLLRAFIVNGIGFYCVDKM
jgi:solute carrier family 25 (mitochondrial carnitine/acylcarnitine transporter), member 20/29